MATAGDPVAEPIVDELERATTALQKTAVA
jgi:hypothetical protein